jgi:hypothetical protein
MKTYDALQLILGIISDYQGQVQNLTQRLNEAEERAHRDYTVRAAEIRKVAMADRDRFWGEAVYNTFIDPSQADKRGDSILLHRPEFDRNTPVSVYDTGIHGIVIIDSPGGPRVAMLESPSALPEGPNGADQEGQGGYANE